MTQAVNISTSTDTRAVDGSTQKLASTLQAMLAASAASTFMNCIVDHVVTGGAPDGTDMVYLKVGADVVTAAYLDASPPAGATVRVEFAGGSPLVHGRVLGKSA